LKTDTLKYSHLGHFNQKGALGREGINNFQKGLSDGDTLNQKKVWIYQPSAGAGFKISNVTHIAQGFIC